MSNKQSVKTPPNTHLKILEEDRLSVVRKMRGVWKNRKPDPIKELYRMRQEWDRTTYS